MIKIIKSMKKLMSIEKINFQLCLLSNLWEKKENSQIVGIEYRKLLGDEETFISW